MKRTLATIVLCLLLAPPAGAGYEADKAVYTRNLMPAAMGQANAQFTLGLLYETGKGVLQDHAASVKWYRQAAEQGHALAQNNLGNLCFKGLGMPQDFALAIRWYRKAAEQGETIAQYNLGYHYANGKGVKRDYVLAYKWFNLGAIKGNRDTMTWRDIVADQMNPDQISRAQTLAREWWSAFERRKGR